MPFNVRYRYVDFATVFTGAPGIRGAEDGNHSPGTLYTNELVTDVGGTCWDRNEPLAIIDHHFPRDGQFPSASAAVLHKAKLIREKFAGQPSEVIWLVTHKLPDFDAFCSLYLARWIIEEPDGAIDSEPWGLHPDGWLDSAGNPKLDWFDPNLHRLPPGQRWALLLAGYASIVDNARHLPCPRQLALHSVLYAALKRGRDYLNQTSGAREFFDEVRTWLQQKQLNPLFDSVLASSSLFAPELAMLQREAEAYERDIRRARKSIVYLPESEAPFPNFFKSVKDVAAPKEKNSSKPAETSAENLLLTDTFRIPTDGIYLRDPECSLFVEWARLDRENSSLGAGFEFTAIAYSGGRPDGSVNQNSYVFSIDPERASGRHLYTVWSRLQTKEVEALRDLKQGNSLDAARPPRSLEKRAGERLFTDPWFDGQTCFGTLVATPHRGTMIGRPGVRGDLRDDPVVEAVRTDIEDSIYLAESPLTGPRVVVTDFSSSKHAADDPSQPFDLDTPQLIPVPREGYFRFGTVGLRADVPITPGSGSRRGLAEQISETLWQVLYPDLPFERPADFFERHLLMTADGVGVWGQRGIVIAQKRAMVGDVARPGGGQVEVKFREDFAGLVALARDLDQWIAPSEALPATLPEASGVAGPTATADLLATRIAAGEQLARRAAQLQSTLALPDRELLRRFSDALGIEQSLGTLRDLQRTATERRRREMLDQQAARAEENIRIASAVQSRLEWLAVFLVGFSATGMIAIFAGRVPGLDQTWGTPFVLLGGLFSLLFAAWILKPWEPAGRKKPDRQKQLVWILLLVLLSCIVGLLFWLRSSSPAHP